jgi:hypothetical protein
MRKVILVFVLLLVLCTCVSALVKMPVKTLNRTIVPVTKEPVVTEPVKLITATDPEPKEQFEEGMEGSDVVVYTGHARYGSGPDLGDNETDAQEQKSYGTTAASTGQMETGIAPLEKATSVGGDEEYLVVNKLRLDSSDLDDYWTYDSIVVNKSGKQTYYYKYNKLGRVVSEVVYDHETGVLSDASALKSMMSGMDPTSSMYMAMMSLLKQAQDDKKDKMRELQAAGQEKVVSAQTAVESKEEEIKNKTAEAKQGFFKTIFSKLFGGGDVWVDPIVVPVSSQQIEAQGCTSEMEQMPDMFGNESGCPSQAQEKPPSVWKRMFNFFFDRDKREPPELNSSLSEDDTEKMDSGHNTDWARTNTTMAGKGRGMWNMTEVDDEAPVMVEVQHRGKVTHFLSYNSLGQVDSETVYDQETGDFSDADALQDMLSSMSTEELSEFYTSLDKQTVSDIMDMLSDLGADSLLALFMKLNIQDPESDDPEFGIITNVNFTIVLKPAEEKKK